MKEKLTVLVDSAIESNDVKGGWASIQNKISVLNLEPDSIRSQLSNHINTFKDILDDLSSDEDKYAVETLKIQFCITKSGEVSIAGFMGGEIGNSTSIEIEIKRK